MQGPRGPLESRGAYAKKGPEPVKTTGSKGPQATIGGASKAGNTGGPQTGALACGSIKPSAKAK